MIRYKIKSILLDLFDITAFLVFALGILLFIRFFIANPFTVIGASMHPSFEEKDIIVVDKVTKRFSDFERWDVIVFIPKWQNTPYIKRIIWLPWEIVKIKDDSVSICSWNNSCSVLSENYTVPDVKTIAKCWKNEFPISNSWYFVMGDNRWFSTDSSCCFWLNCYKWANYEVTDEDIIWRVSMRILPNFMIFK